MSRHNCLFRSGKFGSFETLEPSCAQWVAMEVLPYSLGVPVHRDCLRCLPDAADVVWRSNDLEHVSTALLSSDYFGGCGVVLRLLAHTASRTTSLFRMAQRSEQISTGGSTGGDDLPGNPNLVRNTRMPGAINRN